MVRVDIWDVQKPEDTTPIDLGFPRDLEQRYSWGKKLGKGGFGRVTVVVEKSTGKEYACKSINKHLDVPNFSPQKQAAHLDNVRREVAVLRRLRGTLNVAQIREALEDDESVHIIMEYCKGGELWSCIGRRHYSECTVASYMRAVLRTVAQCHTQKILHRDVKPGNFMLLEDDPLSSVKAIDFGLAVFFEPNKLPRRDLGLEGTPWFMSPETLSSQVGPPSDVWAAGVMAYQLLSGYLPFDDHKNRDAPCLSKIWKAILQEEVSFHGKAWDGVSESAKDFVCTLLKKDPEHRPSAKEALQHEWLRGGHRTDRNLGAPLRHTVVQRIQRYGQDNVLKRTIFEMIAQEIIKMAPDTPTPDPSNHNRMTQAATPTSSGKRDAEESGHASHRAAQLLSSIKRRKSQRALAVLAHGPGGGAMEGPPLIHRDHHSVHGGMEYFQARGESVHNGQQALKASQEVQSSSVHGNNSYWRIMRAAATALKWKSGSVHGRNSYLRYMPRREDEREEQRKAARLALDTSSHASPEYDKILRQCSSQSLWKRDKGSLDGDAAEPMQINSKRPEPGLQSAASLGPKPAAPVLPRKVIPVPQPSNGIEEEEQQVRGRHAYRQFMENQTGRRSFDERIRRPQPLDIGNRSHSYQELPLGDSRPQLARFSLPGTSSDLADYTEQHPQPEFPTLHPELLRTSTPPGQSPSDAEGSSRRGLKGTSGSQADLQMPPKKQVSFESLDNCHHPGSNHGGERSGPRELPRIMGTINISEMKELMRKLNFTREAEGVSEEALAEGLRALGYKLQPDEMHMLAKQVDPRHQSSGISKSAFLASQIDWHREDLRDLWMEAAKRVFADFGRGTAGKVSFTALMSLIREKVPEAEVEYAVEDALVEAGYADEEEMDFDGFLRILQADSSASLDQFDARLPHVSSHDSLAGLAGSPPSASNPASLPPVAEES